MRLEVHELNARFGRAHILFDVDLAVESGQALALLGRNGAGKSTTLAAIIGLVPPSAGRVLVDGRDLAGQPTHTIARAGLGWVPEDRRIFTALTVDENLEVGRRPPRPGAPHWTRERLYALFPPLGELRGRRADRMSGGEQQMLTIARTLMGNPALILLDEPCEGLAPLVVEDMARAIRTMKAEGLGVLLSEQNLRFAERTCDRATIIEKGRIRFDGTMAELAAENAVRDAYLAV